MHLLKSSCRGALNRRLCDDHLIKAITFLQLLCLEIAGFLQKREKAQALGVSLKPHVSWRELEDVLQHWQTAQERRAEDCAFVRGCYCSAMEPTKGKAGCLCEKKRWLGFEMGLCRTANPTNV